MEVIKYRRLAAGSALERVHGYSGKWIEEIWVEQPDGKHFVFNSEGGIFFQDFPLERVESLQAQFEIADSKITTMRRYLDIREGLIEELSKD